MNVLAALHCAHNLLRSPDYNPLWHSMGNSPPWDGYCALFAAAKGDAALLAGLYEALDAVSPGGNFDAWIGGEAGMPCTRPALTQVFNKAAIRVAKKEEKPSAPPPHRSSRS